MCAGEHKYICQYKEVIPQSRSDILGAVELFSKHTHKLIINVFGPRAPKVSVVRGCACVCFTSQPELQKKKKSSIAETSGKTARNVSPAAAASAALFVALAQLIVQGLTPNMLACLV